MADYISKTIDVVKERTISIIGSVMNSPTVNNLWTAADRFKQTWSTEDDFTDASDSSGNLFGNSTAKSVADVVNVFGDKDSNFNKNAAKNAQQMESTITERVFATFTLDVIMKIFILLIILTLASFSANSLIFYPWPLRLFTFIAVLVGCWFFNNIFSLVCAYYIFNAITSVYTNMNLKADEILSRREYFPKLYAFLPLRTAKDKDDWFLFRGVWSIFNILNVCVLWTPQMVKGLTTYFMSGDEGISYRLLNIKKDQYIESIKNQIPEFEKLMDGLRDVLGVPALLAEFENHLEGLNRTYSTANGSGSSMELNPNLTAAELFTKYKAAVTDDVKRPLILKMLTNKILGMKKDLTLPELVDDITKEAAIYATNPVSLDPAIELEKVLLVIYKAVNVDEKKATAVQGRVLSLFTKQKGSIQKNIAKLQAAIETKKASNEDTSIEEAQLHNLQKKLTLLEGDIKKMSKNPAIFLASQKLPTGTTANPGLDELTKAVAAIQTDLQSFEGMTGGAATGAPALTKEETGKQLKIKLKQLFQLFDQYETIHWDTLQNTKADVVHLMTYMTPLQTYIDQLREKVPSAGTAATEAGTAAAVTEAGIAAVTEAGAAGTAANAVTEAGAGTEAEAETSAANAGTKKAEEAALTPAESELFTREKEKANLELAIQKDKDIIAKEVKALNALATTVYAPLQASLTTKDLFKSESESISKRITKITNISNKLKNNASDYTAVLALIPGKGTATMSTAMISSEGDELYTRDYANDDDESITPQIAANRAARTGAQLVLEQNRLTKLKEEKAARLAAASATSGAPVATAAPVATIATSHNNVVAYVKKYAEKAATDLAKHTSAHEQATAAADAAELAATAAEDAAKAEEDEAARRRSTNADVTQNNVQQSIKAEDLRQEANRLKGLIASKKEAAQKAFIVLGKSQVADAVHTKRLAVASMIQKAEATRTAAAAATKALTAAIYDNKVKQATLEKATTEVVGAKSATNASVTTNTPGLTGAALAKERIAKETVNRKAREAYAKATDAERSAKDVLQQSEAALAKATSDKAAADTAAAEATLATILKNAARAQVYAQAALERARATRTGVDEAKTALATAEANLAIAADAVAQTSYWIATTETGVKTAAIKAAQAPPISSSSSVGSTSSLPAKAPATTSSWFGSTTRPPQKATEAGSNEERETLVTPPVKPKGSLQAPP